MQDPQGSRVNGEIVGVQAICLHAERSEDSSYVCPPFIPYTNNIRLLSKHTNRTRVPIHESHTCTHSNIRPLSIDKNAGLFMIFPNPG